MILTDLHNHTLYSHARDTAADMFASAKAKGLSVFGFSEHSPRPQIYTYSHEYRDNLSAHLEDYFREVEALKSEQNGPKVLLGMEIDWFEDDVDFVKKAANQYPFDYLIGSVHFIGTWGFDDKSATWETLPEEERFSVYRRYFLTWKKMISSGLFNIAAHPDLIKIFSVDSFHSWIGKEESQRLVKDGLEALKVAGMAMEISSAGIRKPCKEIYPCPTIMRLASEVGVNVSFASDAHTTQDVAYGFPRLASYAKAFGFKSSVYFDKGSCCEVTF